MLLENSIVKREVDQNETATEPPKLLAADDIKPELKPSPESQPVDWPKIKTEQPVKQELSEHWENESNYASSECSGEFLAEEPKNEERLKQCTVRIETDPAIELMCNMYGNQERGFLCVCGASFKVKGCLERHLKKCTKAEKRNGYKENGDSNSHVCTICQKKFTDSYRFNRHFKYCLALIRERFHEKLFICDVCSKRYTDKYTFTLHIRKCTKQDERNEPAKPPKKPYPCDYCSKRFRTPSGLLIHSRVHSGERPFKCEICGKEFNSGSNFNRHKVTHKFHSEKRYCICDYCGKNYAYKHDMVKHVMRHMKIKIYTCPVCGKKFSTNKHTRHMLTHFPERATKTYRCHVCNKVFLERTNLKIHMRVHTGEKPYSCRVCSMKFAYMTSLKRHEGSHRLTFGCFRCRVCKKCFDYEWILLRHVKYHIWKPGRSVKKKQLQRLDCSVRLVRLSRSELEVKLKTK